MKSSMIRWGILGPGQIAEKFAEAVQESELAYLQSVASRNQERAQAFASKYDAVSSYGSYQDLLKDPNVDAVYIATPHPFHAEWAIRCAEAGKHILCEKPAAMTHSEALAMIAAARSHDVFFMEAFMYRCHPQTQQVIEWVQSGAIGSIHTISADFGFNCGNPIESRLLSKELGGGGILDVGCYPISMARLIAGVSQGLPFQNPEVVKAVGHLHPDTHVDSWAHAVLAFPQGITAQVSCAVQANTGTFTRITGSQGRITLNSPWFCMGSATLENDQGTITQDFGHEQHLYLHEIEIVAKYLHLRQAPSPAMSWEDTLGNMQVLDQWRQEMEIS